MIDLRSDTVTKPTPAMRRAMAEAEVGDDVYGEDPTVNRLEQRAAEILGKQAALFVPTGTMGNTIGIKVNTNHGEEVLCDDRAHILDWELSMTAWFSGCLMRAVPSPDGILRWSDMEPSLRAGSTHNSPTSLVHLEHPHNMGGGTLYPLEEIDSIAERAHQRGLRVHMDGARLFNAVAASGVPAARIAQNADTVMFCLSKGLGAPAGSMLAGSAEAIERGRLYRKRLGGGMRQAGVLAAAGLIALEEMPARLGEDHRQRQVPGGGAGAFARRLHRSRENRHQHRDLRYRRFWHNAGAADCGGRSSRRALIGRGGNARTAGDAFRCDLWTVPAPLRCWPASSLPREAGGPALVLTAGSATASRVRRLRLRLRARADLIRFFSPGLR